MLQCVANQTTVPWTAGCAVRDRARPGAHDRKTGRIVQSGGPIPRADHRMHRRRGAPRGARSIGVLAIYRPPYPIRFRSTGLE